MLDLCTPNFNKKSIVKPLKNNVGISTGKCLFEVVPPSMLILVKGKAITTTEEGTDIDKVGVTDFSPMKTCLFGVNKELAEVLEKKSATPNSERSCNVDWLIKAMNMEMDEEQQISPYPKSYSFNLYRQLPNKYVIAMSDFNSGS